MNTSSYVFISLIYPKQLIHSLGNSSLRLYTELDRQLTMHLLPTGREEREVLGVGSIPVTILPSS